MTINLQGIQVSEAVIKQLLILQTGDEPNDGLNYHKTQINLLIDYFAWMAENEAIGSDEWKKYCEMILYLKYLERSLSDFKAVS